MTWSADERAALLERHAAVADQLIAITGQASRRDEARRLRAEAEEVRQAYVDGIPRVPVSCCPFTGAAFEMALDTVDIDGLFWDYEAKNRPFERWPATVFAVAGAMAIGSPLAETDFLVKPGPEVPYVVPRVLDRPEMKAVVSEVAVGPHRGFPIVYYADPVPQGVARINTWGQSEYWFVDRSGALKWDSRLELERDFDYDLAAWIGAGKLLWIALGDESLELHEHAVACPYLNLPGRRGITRIRYGEAEYYDA